MAEETFFLVPTDYALYERKDDMSCRLNVFFLKHTHQEEMCVYLVLLPFLFTYRIRFVLNLI
jgi:hypothetical protein